MLSVSKPSQDVAAEQEDKENSLKGVTNLSSLPCQPWLTRLSRLLSGLLLLYHSLIVSPLAKLTPNASNVMYQRLSLYYVGLSLDTMAKSFLSRCKQDR